MTLDQIDQTLEAWRAKLSLAADNLLALDDNITYRRLQGKDGLPVTPLSGITRQRVTPALEAMPTLFQDMGLLTQILERATELRKLLSRFRVTESSLREIEQLLFGPSIGLPSDRTPLAQRGLLSASETERAITPERLLAVMTETFEGVRNAIFAVEAAWAKLEPGLAACKTEINLLQNRAERLGEGTLAELATARQKAEALPGAGRGSRRRRGGLWTCRPHLQSLRRGADGSDPSLTAVHARSAGRTGVCAGICGAAIAGGR